MIVCLALQELAGFRGSDYCAVSLRPYWAQLLPETDNPHLWEPLQLCNLRLLPHGLGTGTTNSGSGECHGERGKG